MRTAPTGARSHGSCCTLTPSGSLTVRGVHSIVTSRARNGWRAWDTKLRRDWGDDESDEQIGAGVEAACDRWQVADAGVDVAEELRAVGGLLLQASVRKKSIEPVEADRDTLKLRTHSIISSQWFSGVPALVGPSGYENQTNH